MNWSCGKSWLHRLGSHLFKLSIFSSLFLGNKRQGWIIETPHRNSCFPAQAKPILKRFSRKLFLVGLLIPDAQTLCVFLSVSDCISKGHYCDIHVTLSLKSEHHDYGSLLCACARACMCTCASVRSPWNLRYRSSWASLDGLMLQLQKGPF